MLFRIIFLCFLSDLITANLEVPQGASQVPIIYYPYIRDYGIELKDRSNITVSIKPTKTLRFYEKYDKFHLLNNETVTKEDEINEILEEYKNDEILPFISSLYECDKKIVHVLESFLKNNLKNLDSTLHKMIYRYILLISLSLLS